MQSTRFVLLCLTTVFVLVTSPLNAQQSLTVPDDDRARPNVLWITSEDNGPHLGCFGDSYSTTPNLDGLASAGMIFRNCWSTAPVCAPARTTLISGMFPPSTGAEHMRSMTRLPDDMRMYPSYLRDAGYYCTNNSKEDYNLEKVGEVWNQSNNRAHWRNREDDQPFFAIFNYTVSHESQIRRRPHTPVHDPDEVRIPAYHPDTPETRRDWAQYYDKITEMDVQAGRILAQLEEDGLADETIVFYYGDHGSGMPRSKRWPYNSGLNVPLIIFVPEQFLHLAPEGYESGGESDQLVGFIDFAPTLLSICGIEPPEHFQGHAFMGEYAVERQPYQYGFRGRMDERYDMVRVVRDERFIYIRNYMPHKVYGQYIDYMFQTPTTRVWKQMFDAGELEPPQTYFWQRKPPEELYDLWEDVDEVNNLADSPDHQEILARFRTAHIEWALEIRDVGFLPEHEIHQRAADASVTPYEYGQSDDYNLRLIMETAHHASMLSEDATDALVSRLGDDDSAVRYWAMLGLLMRGDDAIGANLQDIANHLADPSPTVQILASQAIGSTTDDAQLLSMSLDILIEYANVEEHGIFHAMLALNALDELDRRATSVDQEIAELPKRSEQVHQRLGNYVDRLIGKTLEDIR